MFLLFLMPVLCSQTKADWELKKDANGIQVFVRNAPDSKFKELRSETVIKTSLSSIVALLGDWDAYPQWVYRCGKSSTLKRLSETEVIHYQTAVAPWPVDNRDFVVNVKLNQDPVTKTVSLRSTCLPTYIPPVAGHVRITEFRASWTLTPMKDGNTKVEYQLMVNPGGSLPAWLVNLAVVDGPYETTLHMKEWVKKDKYRKASFSYIQEP